MTVVMAAVMGMSQTLSKVVRNAQLMIVMRNIHTVDAQVACSAGQVGEVVSMSLACCKAM